MIKGFSLLEVLVALTISLSILTVVFTNVTESARHSKKVITNQQRIEAIFHTMDSIRTDLTKCGMRLNEASTFFSFPLFENGSSSFKVIYGIEKEPLLEDSTSGGNTITMNRNEFFQKKKKIVIYDPERKVYEINEIKEISGNQFTLLNNLQNDYARHSTAVIVNEVEYKLYSSQNALKRKINNGYFQPLMEEVTDFQITFYPEFWSVHYMIEANHKEQISGYIFLTHMMVQ
jgi:prepilin-type N-terminal cleavage/methylation domain-containing protein